MKEKELIAKYHDVVSAVSKANECDSGVAISMIKHEFYAKMHINGRTHKYAGIPEGFNYTQFAKDAGII